MKLREISSVLILIALTLYAIHTLAHKKSSDDDSSARDVNISITTEKIVIGDDLFSSEIDCDDLENN